MSSYGISAFLLCYNDAETIGVLVHDALATLRELTDDFEIIVVNDGSRDDSAQVLRGLQSQVECLRIVSHPTNRGFGGAVRSGFAAATKDLIFYTDGDGQYDVKELRLLYAALADDVDFVNGAKMTRHDPAYRVYIGNLHNLFMRWCFWLPIADVDCDFRLIRRSVIARLRLTTDSGSICTELVKRAERAGARFREVPVHHYARRSGQSQFFKPLAIAQTYADLARLWVKLALLGRDTR